MANVDFDDKDFQKKIKAYAELVMGDNRIQAIHNVATEILRLSAFQVPHDKGTLQNSGSVQDLKDESVVGYHTPYAARLHEHPEYAYQKGRKGKYLEDPIKTNLSVFKKYMNDMISGKKI
jgi:hypothetical protein